MTSAAAVAYRLANVGRKGAVRVINCSFRLCPSMQRAIIAARDIFARGSLYGLAEESPRERGSQYASNATYRTRNSCQEAAEAPSPPDLITAEVSEAGGGGRPATDPLSLSCEHNAASRAGTRPPSDVYTGIRQLPQSERIRAMAPVNKGVTRSIRGHKSVCRRSTASKIFRSDENLESGGSLRRPQ